MNYLLDTCVISEARKKQAHPNLIQWLNSVDESRFYLSVIIFGEIQKGIEKLKSSARKQELSIWVEQDLQVRFTNKILSIDNETSIEWGLLSAQREKIGLPLPVIDGLIAATAIQHNLTLVTRNVSDFIQLPLRVLNPWEIMA